MQCSRIGCSLTAQFRPRLTFAAEIAPKGPRAAAELNLYLCSAHKAETQIDDLVSDVGWDQICGALDAVGRAKPDRSTLGLEWEAIS